MVTVEEAFKAIDNNDIETLREYLTPHQEVSPTLWSMLDSMVGRAVDRNKYDVVEFLLKEVCIPARKVINDWHVKHAWQKGHYKIHRLLLANSR
jgi:hypothetical protein